jgi:hypothetical protein
VNSRWMLDRLLTHPLHPSGRWSGSPDHVSPA